MLDINKVIIKDFSEEIKVDIDEFLYIINYDISRFEFRKTDKIIGEHIYLLDEIKKEYYYVNNNDYKVTAEYVKIEFEKYIRNYKINKLT